MSGNDKGVSKRALSLARVVDRLPPGEYVLRLSKFLRRDGGMIIEISKTEKIREVGHGQKSN